MLLQTRIKFLITIRSITLVIALSVIGLTSTAQSSKEEKKTVYKVNRKIEIPVTAVLMGTYILGLDWVQSKSPLSVEEVEILNPDDIWWFDRSATQQDPSYRDESHTTSDIIMKASVALPAFLIIDKDIRHDWFNVLTLYGQAHAASGNLYVVTAGLYDRIRPFVYSSGIPTGDKLDTGTKNSFFSGHTSTTAVSTFFFAKVISDYHPELGNKKFLVFAGALVPPIIVGYYRYKAMKHFPTDILVGLTIGASAGILIPHFHKKKKSEAGFSFLPYAGPVSGLKITYRFP